MESKIPQKYLDAATAFAAVYKEIDNPNKAIFGKNQHGQYEPEAYDATGNLNAIIIDDCTIMQLSLREAPTISTDVDLKEVCRIVYHDKDCGLLLLIMNPASIKNIEEDLLGQWKTEYPLSTIVDNDGRLDDWVRNIYMTYTGINDIELPENFNQTLLSIHTDIDVRVVDQGMYSKRVHTPFKTTPETEHEVLMVNNPNWSDSRTIEAVIDYWFYHGYTAISLAESLSDYLRVVFTHDPKRGFFVNTIRQWIGLLPINEKSYQSELECRLIKKLWGDIRLDEQARRMVREAERAGKSEVTAWATAILNYAHGKWGPAYFNKYRYWDDARQFKLHQLEKLLVEHKLV